MDDIIAFILELILVVGLLVLCALLIFGSAKEPIERNVSEEVSLTITHMVANDYKEISCVDDKNNPYVFRVNDQIFAKHVEGETISVIVVQYIYENENHNSYYLMVTPDEYECHIYASCYENLEPLFEKER